MNNLRPPISPAPSTLQQHQQAAPPPMMQQHPPVRFPTYQSSQQSVQMPPYHQQPYRHAAHGTPRQGQMPIAPAAASMQQRPPDCGAGGACLPSPMPLSTQQQHEQTMMWGMQNYVMTPHDSGFQSRATRSVVSSATSCYSSISNLTGLDSECGDFSGMYPGPAGPSGPIFIQSGASANFDTGAGNFDFNTSQQAAGCFATAQQACVHQGGPLLHPDAQREVERVVAAIQELIKMLRDDSDLVSVKSAAFIVHNMAKTIENARLMVQNADLIDAIVATMHTGMTRKDDELLKSTTGALYVLSNADEIQKQGLEAIYQSGAVPLLIGLLGGEFEAVLYFSVTVLHNLLSYHPHAREAIRAADAVASFVKLLARDHDKFLAIVADCLRILCTRHAETTMKVCEYGAPAYLVRILERSNYEKVLHTTARLIQTLSLCHYNKPAIVAAGGVHALARHLAHPSHRLVLSCLDALRMLSDAATYVEGVDGLLNSCIQNLGSSDEMVVHYCVSILYNMTCKNAANKDYVCRQMGIESLTRTLNEWWHRPPIAEDTLGVLRHLTWRWGGVRESRNKLRSTGCLPLIARYLRAHELPPQFNQHPGVIVEALSLIRNLSLDGGASWPDFRNYGIVDSAAALAVMIRNNMNNVVNQPPILNMYLDAMERALTALSGLCQDDTNRQILLAHPNLGPLANDLLNHPVANIKQAAATFLTELQRQHSAPGEAAIDEGIQDDEPPSDLRQDGRFPFQAELVNAQYQAQGASTSRHPASFNFEEEEWRVQQQRERQMQQQQQMQQSVAMPSPMSWSQQEMAAVGYGSTNFDATGDFFDCGIANSLLNDVDFGSYDEAKSEPQQSDSGAGPSYASSCSAVEPMKKLHL